MSLIQALDNFMPSFETRNITSKTMSEVMRNALQGFYDYIVIHSDGNYDYERQDAAINVLDVNARVKTGTRLFLNGYECVKPDGRLKTLEETFSEDSRLRGRRPRFPKNTSIEIAHAINTPENCLRLREREYREKNNLLVVTHLFHQSRVMQVMGYYFTEDRPEQIHVLGINGKFNTLGRYIYERGSIILTGKIFRGIIKGEDPEKITEHYNRQRYSHRGNLPDR